MNNFDNTKRLTLLVGLPFSGKSTVAKTRDFPIVSPDAIRTYYYRYNHKKPTVDLYREVEPVIWASAKMMVYSLFNAGHREVTLDATNLTQEQRAEWYSPHWHRAFINVNTPIETCIARAIDQKNVKMAEVIHQMAPQLQFATKDELKYQEVPQGFSPTCFFWNKDND